MAKRGRGHWHGGIPALIRANSRLQVNFRHNIEQTQVIRMIRSSLRRTVTGSLAAIFAMATLAACSDSGSEKKAEAPPAAEAPATTAPATEAPKAAETPVAPATEEPKAAAN